MDRGEFLELVLGKQTPVTIETWDVARGKGSRREVSFDEAVKVGGEEVFFVPRNGTLLTLASDSDDRQVNLTPSVVVETDHGSFNNYWRMQGPVSHGEASIMLSYLDPLSPPRSTETFRMPGTISTKRGSPFTCRITLDTGKTYTSSQIFGIDPPEDIVQPFDLAWVRGDDGPFLAGDLGKALLWGSRLKHPIPKALRVMMERQDGSVASLMRRLILHGLSERDAIWCAEAALCNPFRGWRYGQREALAKTLVISRAQGKSSAIKDMVTKTRADTSEKIKPFEIRNKMAKQAIDDFQQACTVLHANDGSRWAIDRNTGTAMELLHGSDTLKYWVNRRYGINPVDIDHHHLVDEMIGTALLRPPTAKATSISFYEHETNRMLVSFGGREVAVLGPAGMSFEENGVNGTIFKPVMGADPLATRLLPVDKALQEEKPGEWWQKILPPEMLQNLTRGDPEEISALLHVWTIFFMFRNIAASRPILGMFGAAGSGKTTLAKKLHLLFYGDGVKLFQVKNHGSWTTTLSNYPLALFDNVDEPTPWWLPPALALSITPTDATVRMLYSNNTPYIQRMDAMIGISSHDAGFLREDVIDRMVLLQFRRIENRDRLEEGPMLADVLASREGLLARLMADIVHVLGTAKPAPLRGSSIRIVDFLAIGTWIARAIGKEDAFLSAVGSLSVQQTAKVLEEDIIVVTALEDLQRLSPMASEWVTHTHLWQELLSFSEDGGDALKSQYKGAAVFGRKLSSLASHLEDALGVETKDDEEHGWRLWRLGTGKEKK